jgi:predicted lipoprotein with Yx(FWY)xxD motif
VDDNRHPEGKGMRFRNRCIDDGVRQWTYKGKPICAWPKDAKPGDMTGYGFNNLWRVVKD